MKHNALAILLTVALAGLLGAGLWWDAQRKPVAVLPAPPAAAPTGGTAVPQAVPRPVPGANALVRCEHAGKVTYQAAPCPSGARQGELAGGTFSIVNPPKVVLPPPAPATSTAREGGTVGLIARSPSPGELNAGRCELLEREIDRIDEAARRGGSSQYQEWLREQRRRAKDEMWRLKCGF